MAVRTKVHVLGVSKVYVRGSINYYISLAFNVPLLIFPVMEETYTGQAFRIVFECLRLLAFCLRAALLAKLEEGEVL